MPNRSLLRALMLLSTVAIVSGLGASWKIAALRAENLQLRRQVHQAIESRPPPECPVARVVCECPAYEQGWDDAEVAGGCDPGAEGCDLESLDDETLETICGELGLYGYVPRC